MPCETGSTSGSSPLKATSARGQVYGCYKNLIYSFARRYGASPEDAGDVFNSRLADR